MFPVWMGELARRSGVPVPTVKYYLREGLLPPGESHGATRASYGEGHVQRLVLIRALTGVAGMSLDRVRDVLAVIDDTGTDVAAAMGAAHLQLSPAPPGPVSARSAERVSSLIAARGWTTDPDGGHARALAAALDAMDHAGLPMSAADLAVYVDAAASVAAADLASVGTRDRTDATTYAVLGTLLAEPVLVSLRRMAQEDLARRGLSS
jgi:DNA-binding transcriptional MerR regulator